MNPVLRIAPEEIPPHVAARWSGRLSALWGCGNLDLVDRPLVAMIGTRRPSPRGCASARAWARVVCRAGGVVLSGGAVGIDLEAHRGALESGGSTIVVPARGLDRYTPPSWFKKYANSGNWLFLTNLALGEDGSRSAPVRRNALVAALADVVLVVETPPRGGTAYVANGMRRRGGPVAVVEFDPKAPVSCTGNHALVLAGARGLPERPTPASTRGLSQVLTGAFAARPNRDTQPDLFNQETTP